MHINEILKLTNISQKITMLQITQEQNFDMFLVRNSVFYYVLLHKNAIWE